MIKQILYIILLIQMPEAFALKPSSETTHTEIALIPFYFNGHQVDLPLYAKIISVDTSTSYGNYMWWQVAFGYDTLHVASYSQWFQPGTRLFKPYPNIETYMTVCGNYKGPGFCAPEFTNLPEISYPLDSAEYMRSYASSIEHNSYELIRLMRARDVLEKKMETSRAATEFDLLVHPYLYRMAANYESGPQKMAGVQMEMTYEARDFYMQYNYMQYHEDSSFTFKRFSISAEIDNLNTIASLEKVMPTFVIDPRDLR